MEKGLDKKTAYALGREAEQAACAFLQEQGLQLIQQNYRSSWGEIDLILMDQDVYTFVEVRFRDEGAFVSGIETITTTKQRRIIKTALHYLQANRLLYKVRCRFDVVGAEQNGGTFKFQWIKSAFMAK
ncbi:MAG: YraN family protein [Gammaproteobacteria bacterium GWE2_42_36]|nr:MAG: YraN family protein [Gammaproteobacteria bacterium GWE2_42_36]HCU05790.1 YraN family protein [Coxiellaceae bacterium]